MDWVIVKDTWNHKPIGAVGFVGDEVAVVTAFYHDKDANEDGKVSFKEKIFSFGPMGGRAVTKVANHAYANPDILMRDPSFGQLRGRITTKFATGLLAEGVYRVYFSQAIGRVSGAVASQFASGAVQSFVIKKGLETAVKKAYQSAVQ